MTLEEAGEIDGEMTKAKEFPAHLQFHVTLKAALHAPLQNRDVLPN